MQDTKSVKKKSIVFLYTNNNELNRKRNKTIPCAIVSKTLKYLGINLANKVKDLYTERSIKHG